MSKRTVSGITLPLLFLGMLTLAFNIEMVEAEPKTIIVPDDYPTIQEAVNNADEEDTIFVRNGTYYENVVVDKTVSLIGESREAIVSQNYTDYTVEVRKDNVTVRGFTIQNNRTHVPYGILVNSSSDCQIIGNRVGPVSSLQAGIVVHGGSGNRILKNEIADCSVDGIIVGQSIGNVIMENTMNAHFVGLDLVGSNYNYVYFNHFYVHWASWACVSLWRSNSNIIEGNTLLECGWEGLCRMELRESCNNSIFHNNFNGLVSSHVSIDESSKNNAWDDGYPSGGNYWIDHACIGNPSNGSQPHIIDENNIDHYPFQDPNGWLLHPPDETPPSIGVPFREPEEPLLGQSVRISVNITDAESGVKSAILCYKAWKSNWCNLTMFYNTTVQLYQAIIPAGFPGGTLILYKIIAYDNAGNCRVEDNAGAYYVYTVIGGSEWLTIYSSPTEATFTVNGISYVTPWSGCYNENDSVSLVMPEIHTVGDARYYWNQWSDGNTSRSRTVTMNTDITLTAHYTGPYYQLTVTSSTLGIQFTINGTPVTTRYTEWLLEGSYILEMSQTHTVYGLRYYWDQWSDGVISRIRTVTMNTSITLTAYYAGPYYQLTVTSSPITGIPFTINGVPQKTPHTEWLLEGFCRLIMPETYYGYVWSHWLEDGDTDRIKTITQPRTLPRTTYTAVYTEPPIGGYSLPIKECTTKPLTLYLAIVAILTVSFTMIKRKTRRRTKQS